MPNRVVGVMLSESEYERLRDYAFKGHENLSDAVREALDSIIQMEF